MEVAMDMERLGEVSAIGFPDIGKAICDSQALSHQSCRRVVMALNMLMCCVVKLLATQRLHQFRAPRNHDICIQFKLCKIQIDNDKFLAI